MGPKVWGYIGNTKIIERNPEKKDEAFQRGFKILAEINIRRLKEEKIKNR